MSIVFNGNGTLHHLCPNPDCARRRESLPIIQHIKLVSVHKDDGGGFVLTLVCPVCKTEECFNRDLAPADELRGSVEHQEQSQHIRALYRHLGLPVKT